MEEENKIEIYDDSKIYVLCPAYFKTGGTELLHQLVNQLNRNSIKSFITYVNCNDDENINPAFSNYVSEFKKINDIEDSSRNVLIVPETYTYYLKKYNNIKKVIWWESVDFYLMNKSIMFNLRFLKDDFKNTFKRILRCLIRNKTQLSIKGIRKIPYHFVQSEYAKRFLELKKVNTNIYYVSDYINQNYLDECNMDNKYIKENIICYNPKKGHAFTSKLISKCPGFRFIPLINMTNLEVKELLKKSKIYIDFGNHPGKDRFPREAAIMGCCILTGLKGAAKYYEDIPIFKEYKIKDKKKNISVIKFKLEDILLNFDENYAKFSNYREFILREKSKFLIDSVYPFEIQKEDKV